MSFYLIFYILYCKFITEFVNIENDSDTKRLLWTIVFIYDLTIYIIKKIFYIRFVALFHIII